LAIREQINQWATSDDAGLFTVNTMTKFLGKDKIQVRNAINALTDVTLVRWAEKFQTSPGAREIVYKPVSFDVGI
jgi:predicted transcriptional regulator